MGDNDWMYALGLAPGLLGSAKSKNDASRKKYEQSRRAAMEAYQRDLDAIAMELQGAYGPSGAESSNVVRRYGVAGEMGGAAKLYEELDPQLAPVYRQRVLEGLNNPAGQYDESVNDILARIEEEAAGGAVGRGVYGSGLHAQDYSKRALQTLTPFRLQAITNALNRGENFAKTLELMRSQAVSEYEPVRQREVQGAKDAANLRAGGSAARYGTEADIAEGNVNRYLGREAAVGQLLGKAASAGISMATGGMAGGAPTATGASSQNPLDIYADDLYSDGGYGEYTSPLGADPAELDLARQRVARERNPYGRGV